MNLAAEAQRLIALAQNHSTSQVLDKAAEPLLAHLKAIGKIGPYAYVEWQGAWEHGLIAINHMSEEEFNNLLDLQALGIVTPDPSHWFQIEPSGEHYAV